MAGGKETPRQKMIGMMYLVLTALLALNVSKSILEAFVRMNASIRNTNENFMQSNEKLYVNFKKANANDPKKAGPYWEKAQEIRDRANSLYNYISSSKAYIMKEVDGVPRDSLENMSSLDNYDIPSLKLGLAQPSNPKGKDWGKYTALELEHRIDDFRKFLKVTLHETTDGRVDTTGKTFSLATKGKPEADDPAAHSWGGLNFYHSPAAAVITTFSKLQSDIRNAESDVVDILFSQVSAEDFKFDKIEGMVLENSFVAVGDTYEAQIVAAAYSSTIPPKFEIGKLDTSTNELEQIDTTEIPFSYTVKNGKVFLRAVPQNRGEELWDGNIVIEQGGNTQKFPVSGGFRAAEQNAVVSPTKMNVFYRGVRNPISVSVPGVPPGDLDVGISGGSLSSDKGEGNYIVKPGSGSKAIVRVKSKKTGKSFGKKEFRVQRVPDPKPYFLGNTIGDDRIKASKLSLAPGVRAVMENFQFDLKYTVTSFKMSMTVGGQLRSLDSKSAKVTGDMKELLEQAKPGQTIFIRDIVARGPDGSRPLANLSFKTF